MNTVSNHVKALHGQPLRGLKLYARKNFILIKLSGPMHALMIRDLRVGMGVIGDIFKVEERGTASGLFFAVSLLSTHKYNMCPRLTPHTV